jgi:hypothetical protein
MGTSVQFIEFMVLAEIPATRPADAHSSKKFGLHQPRSLQTPPSQFLAALPQPPTPSPLPRRKTHHPHRHIGTGRLRGLRRWKRQLPPRSFTAVARGTPLGSEYRPKKNLTNNSSHQLKPCSTPRSRKEEIKLAKFTWVQRWT